MTAQTVELPQPFNIQAEFAQAGLTTEEGVKTAFTRKETVAAMKATAKYVKANSSWYGYYAKENGVKAAAERVVEDMRLDGYGAILDVVSDNLLALLTIIVLVALIPFLAWQITSSFNTTGMDEAWQDGLQAPELWAMASMLVGAVITISLVTLVIVQLRKFRNNSD